MHVAEREREKRNKHLNILLSSLEKTTQNDNPIIFRMSRTE